jgi:hypothetical protein
LCKPPASSAALSLRPVTATTMNHVSSPRPQSAALERLPWESPSIARLPRLTELTLATGGGIPGGGDIGGGSTVIP